MTIGAALDVQSGACNRHALGNSAGARVSPIILFKRLVPPGVQVHPLSLIRYGIVLQDAETAAELVRSEWRYRPIICIGPPNASKRCSAVALAGCKKVQKHPVTREPLPCSHDGIYNVYGSSGGLLAEALQRSKINSVQRDFVDSATFTLNAEDADYFSSHLAAAWSDRDKLVWCHEGRRGLLEQ